MTQAIVGLFPKERVSDALDVLYDHGIHGFVSGDDNGGTEPFVIAANLRHVRQARILIGRRRKRGRA
ncbi:MAG: hypothetical protein JOZ41_20720 [Chloroflexi bacterium]|nr:hypothetical protein [Chloroflexota bacterium]